MVAKTILTNCTYRNMSSLVCDHSFTCFRTSNDSYRYALVLEFSPSPEYGAVKPICLPFLGLNSRNKVDIFKEKEDLTKHVVRDVLEDVLDRIVMLEEKRNDEKKEALTAQTVVSEILKNILTNVTNERTNHFEEEVKELEDVLTSAENALNDSRELRNSISSLSPKNRRDTSSGFLNEKEEEEEEEKEEEEEEKDEEKTQLLVENEEDLLLPIISDEPPPTTSNEIPAQFPSSYKIVRSVRLTHLCDYSHSPI